MVVVIDGNSLKLEDFIRVAIYNEKVELSNEARKTVIENRKKVELMISKGEPIYGINTGFGELVNLRIDEIKERELQINLLRSHSTGYGEPLKREFVRGIILSILKLTSSPNPVLIPYIGSPLEIISSTFFLFSITVFLASLLNSTFSL